MAELINKGTESSKAHCLKKKRMKIRARMLLARKVASLVFIVLALLGLSGFQWAGVAAVFAWLVWFSFSIWHQPQAEKDDGHA